MKKSILTLLLPCIALGSFVPQAMSKAELRNIETVKGELEQNVVRTARETTTLRCWQEGKLLFEETHLASEATPKNAQVFNASTADQKIHLFNTGTATCMYKKI